MHQKTLRVRVHDNHSARLRQMAKQVNFVWNYINELSHRVIREKGQFLSAFDVQHYTKGASKELGLHSQVLQMIGKEYVTRRLQFKKSKLAWRKSYGAKRSLGWIPLNAQSIKWQSGQLIHNGQFYKVRDSYGLSQYALKSGSFSEDARGRWYFNVVVEVTVSKSVGTGAVGLDLGCKDAVTDSNGERIAGREYRRLEQQLCIAQRARHKRRAKAIHAKIRNRRQDTLHKYSHKLVNENAAIFVGNVSSTSLTKTRLAKSVLDAGWGILKTMLAYKCERAGVVFEVVNEAYTTQTCSCCGCISDSSPKGRAGLRIREWTCVECGITHDRDINAARNILALGHGRLAVGIPKR